MVLHAGGFEYEEDLVDFGEWPERKDGKKNWDEFPEQKLCIGGWCEGLSDGGVCHSTFHTTTAMPTKTRKASISVG